MTNPPESGQGDELAREVRRVNEPLPLPKQDREAVARIIDPWPFGIVANITHTERAARERDFALAKADAILALLQLPEGG